MISNTTKKDTERIKKALLEILLEKTPPKEFSTHIEDLVNLLTDALMIGEYRISLEEKSVPNGILGKGWPEDHIRYLTKSGWAEGNKSPMVLSGKYLSWRRWSEEINDITNELISKIVLAAPQKSTNVVHLSKRSDNLNPEQKQALEEVKRSGLLLISGGPGTGKTHTIIGILEIALTLNPGIKIGLAAPTGKATRRLKDTLIEAINVSENKKLEKLKAVPCKTLHRWLEYKKNYYGKSEDNPLSIDLLVIDEMSMVNLSLIKAVLKALPIRSQLILVGDKNQLPPIGSGSIWHEIQLNDVLKRFNGSAINLKKVYRNRGSIASLSRSLSTKGLKFFWKEVERLKSQDNVKIYLTKSEQIPTELVLKIKAHLSCLDNISQGLIKNFSRNENNPIGISEEDKDQSNLLFKKLEELMILSPRKNGLFGVNYIHNYFLGSKYKDDINNLPQGTPVICGENQLELGLSNGDIGVVVGSKENARLIFRCSKEGEEQKSTMIHPARVKNIQPAIAITIHKSQGSEAKEVILFWPDNSNESDSFIEGEGGNLNYEKRLLYTAITRAKLSLHLIRKR